MTVSSLIKPEFTRYPDGDRVFNGLLWSCYKTGSSVTAIFALDGMIRVSRASSGLRFTSYKASDASPLGWLVISATHRTERGACIAAVENWSVENALSRRRNNR